MSDSRPTSERQGAPLFSSFDEARRWFAAGGQLTPMTDWRQRLTGGRAQFLSFQVPLGETSIADAVEELQVELRHIDGLAVFEREMLHISLRGVGFQVIARKRPDDISRGDVGRITKQAAGLIRGAKPFAIQAGPLNVFPGSLILEVHDGGELAGLRSRLAATADDTYGIGDAEYLPHVTIAMFADPDTAAPALRERLPSLRRRPHAAATIKRIELARWWFTGAETDFPERDPVRAYALR